ncbi:MAG: hypothetical protein HZA53_05895 [Planctomycetes bacterium]|nr:hypothetical protein [Planctomycetota bacterium]
MQAKIASIEVRTKRREARANPAVKQAIVAVRAIDRGLAGASDTTMKGALLEARTTLAACVAVAGVTLAPTTVSAAPRKRRVRSEQVEEA